MSGKGRSYFVSILIFILILFIIIGPFYFIYVKEQIKNNTIKKEEYSFKGVISFWDYPKTNTQTGSRYGWILKKIKRFEKENPGVYIEFKPLSRKTGHMLLDTAVDTKTYPDIAPVATDMRIISKGLLENVDKFMTEEEVKQYKTDAIKAVKCKGKIWGFPYTMSTYNLLLNVEMFNERGIEIPKEGNWTYDEFVETLKKLTVDENDDGKMDYYGFNAYIGVNDYSLWGILLSDGGEVFNNKGEYIFNDSKAISGVKRIVDLKNKYKVVPDDFGESSEIEAWKSFYKDKKIGVYPAGTWAVNTLTKAYESGEGFEFEVANYPTGNREKTISAAKVTSAYGIFKQEDEEKLKMCVKFLKFLSKDEYQRSLNEVGVFPVKKDIEKIYTGNAKMDFVEQNLKYTKNISNPNWNITQEYFYSQLRQILLKNKNVKEALDQAKNKIDTYRSIKKE
ncbi:ABC transporter substrate-binding protein [Anaeromicrobium sediminis]|uniref:ABC transporter substrate-binding protein n=1 Tax=Anaeromicrobium sediminis TaxID=1478221 RepID=UPI00159550C5|nr:extracellular solute-binding protein [Anaeromicrobium sediminis]